MIELPEAITIASQIDAELHGRQISSGLRGQSPHKFAFTGRHSDEEFDAIAKDKRVGRARADGNVILVDIEPGYVLSLGCGGERILYHTNEKTLPKRHQLLMHFHDGTALSVTISGWGELRLLEASELADHPHIRKDAVSPLSAAFTFDYFDRLFEKLPDGRRVSAKYFLISDPGVWGIGNGCIQDILYRAKIHPKRQMTELTDQERRTLYAATRQTLKEMVELGGRDGEKDLYNQFGRYPCLLHSRTVGHPCPECGTPIEKSQYLGGSVYFCPTCQAL
jgi:formamidopyrimidine-DNA glycosylase